MDCVTLMLVIGMLISGSANTLSKKAQFDCYAYDREGTYYKFDHAWLQTATMFFGEWMCISGFFYKRWKKNRGPNRQIQGYKPIDSDGKEHKEESSFNGRVFRWLFMLPASLDLLGTTIAGVGLIYTNASVWQMLRGSIVIFTALLSVMFLGRKLEPYHYIGMLGTLIGLTLVGVSSIYAAKDKHEQDDVHHSGGEMAFGVCLVVLGQLCSAMQMVIEEKFLKSKNFHPMHVVGMEGFFGFWMMMIVLPIVSNIPPPPEGDKTDIRNVFHDSALDGLYQMKDNPRIILFAGIYLSSIGCYNVFGMSVAKKLSSVHRTLIDAMRTVVVWGFNVVIYYCVSETFGEELTIWSTVQCGGFFFLVTGTLIYNKILKLPDSCYKEKKEQPLLEGAETRPSFKDLQQGLGAQSPMIRQGTPTMSRMDYNPEETPNRHGRQIMNQ